MADDALLATLAAAALGVAALRFSEGWRPRWWTMNGGAVSAGAAGGGESENGLPSAPTGQAGQTLGEWALERSRAFAARAARMAAAPTASPARFLELYRERGEVMQELYARRRFLPNDTRTLEEMDGQIRETDAYMARSMDAVRAAHRELRFVYGPLSCGDGDARLASASIAPAPPAWTPSMRFAAD